MPEYTIVAGVRRSATAGRGLPAGAGALEEGARAHRVLGHPSAVQVHEAEVLAAEHVPAVAGSLVEAAAALKKAGAQDVYAAITHPVLSGPAIKRIDSSQLQKLFVTNTIPVEDGKQHEKIKVLSIAPLLAEAIRRIHGEESVSSLFD